MRTAPYLSFHAAGLPRRLAAAMVGSVALLLVLPAHAAREVEEVTQLLEQGRAEQAAIRADQFLQQNPSDAEMRFLRGVIATEQKQPTQAIQIFSALARDYPGMPEPYNNLAVLYAAQGQERKAADALEQAIRAQPGYAVAHENLGDLYARMASQSYAKALELDGAGQRLAPQQAMMAQIPPGEGGASVLAAPLALALSPPAEPAVAVAPAVESAHRLSVPPPVAAAAPSSGVSEAQEVSSAAVQAVVLAWAKAWAQQDMDAYLAAYSPRFGPADGSSLAAWTQSRRQRIEGKGAISVSLSDLQVAVQGEQATARFVQAYAAGALKSNARKTLVLHADKGQWRIVSETVGR